MNDGSEWNVHYRDEPIPVLPCQTIEIVAALPTSPSVDAKNLRNFHVWPVVRRQLVEARDRLAPLLKRVSNFSMKPNET